MKKSFKIAIGAVILIVAVAGGLYARSMPLAVEGITLTPVLAENYFIEQGFVKDNKNIDVISHTSGKVLKVTVSENDKVNKDDIICILDDTDILYQIEQSKNQIAGYKAQINSLYETENSQKDNLRISLEVLKGELNKLDVSKNVTDLSKEEAIKLQQILTDESKSQYEKAIEDFEKSQKLYETSIISKSELDKEKSTLESLKATYEANLQQLNISKNSDAQTSTEYIETAKAALNAQIKETEAQLQKSSVTSMRAYYNALINASDTDIKKLNENIEDCIVKSAVTGTIVSLPVADTNYVMAGSKIAEISSESENLIEVYVPTKEIYRIHKGDEVYITVKREPEDYTFTGNVAYIDDKAIAKISSLGIEERKVKIEISYINSSVLSGFPCDVKFVTYKENDKITVPKTATFKDADEKNYVWLINNNELIKKEIILGEELRADYVVSEGLNNGDIIVKNIDDDKLREGSNVKIGK